MTLIPVVLSGGSGTRLWPLSRASFPKQLLKLISDSTMIQSTVDRLKGLSVSDPIVVCNENHRIKTNKRTNARKERKKQLT